jgi:competence protein ComEC
MAAGFAAGACLGGGLGGGAARCLLICAVVLLAAAPRTGSLRAGAAVWSASLAAGAASAATERLAQEAHPLKVWAAEHREQAVLLEGLVASPIDARDGWRGLRLAVRHVEDAGRRRNLAGSVDLRIFGEARLPDLAPGDLIQAWATLPAPRARSNPGISDDRTERARRDGIHAQASCKSARLVTRLERGRGPWRGRALHAARDLVRGRLDAAILPGQERALVKAMVIGDRAGLDEATLEAFRAAGTFHVLAISGAQVALLAWLLDRALALLVRQPAPRAWLSCPLVLAYAAFVGGQSPVARAALAACVFLAGRAVDLRSDLANLLGLAALVLLAGQPSLVRDVSFQLSFGATLGLILFTARVRSRLPRLPLSLDLALAGTVAAQAAVLPIQCAVFHRLAPAALVLNLAAVPLSGLVLVSGVVTALASGVSPVLGGWAGDGAWIAAHGLLRSADLVGALPWLDVRVPDPPAWAVGLYAVGLALVARGGGGARALAGLGMGAAGLALGASPRADGRLHLAVLDVGQGDALVVTSPRGRVLVVDGGPSTAGFDAGRDVVAPYLWALGQRRVQRLVLSHAHPDHAGGLGAIARAFAVAELWEGPAPQADPSYRNLGAELPRSALARRSVVRGVREAWDGAEVEVLSPRARAGAPWRVRNDDSVVIRLRYGRIRMLLTGDVEAAAEAALAEDGPVAVLKVAHHGSRTSSTEAFLEPARPAVAVVSVGARNPFGHPHAETLHRLSGSGAMVIRTDRHGGVTVSTDGTRLWVATAADHAAWEVAMAPAAARAGPWSAGSGGGAPRPGDLVLNTRSAVLTSHDH